MAGLDLVKFSMDIAYQTNNFTQKGTIANENASGLLADLPKHILKNALKVPYFCEPEEFKSICMALKNRLCLLEPELEATHPTIKFLAEHMIKNFLKKNYRDKQIKIVGAKLNKAEAQIKSEKEPHFCFLYPELEDHYRMLESMNANEVQADKLEARKRALEIHIKALSDSVRKNPPSNYSVGMRDQIEELLSETIALDREINKMQDFSEVLESSTSKILKNCCNVGAEECPVKADIVLGFDSFYDIDLKKAFDNFNEIGASEVYLSLVIPFGLMFVDEYYSDELGVFFRKTKKGFIMTHNDMSNGYIHENSRTILGLMDSSFIELDSGSWVSEIVNSTAEICLLKFTKSKNMKKTVRKLLPRKFDKYSVILNPMDYFGPYKQITPMFVEKTKLEAIIGFVGRYKNSNKTIIQETLSFAQSLFMSVAVGSTVLQEGSELCNAVLMPMVLYAILDASFNLGQTVKCMSKAKPRGFLKSIWNVCVDTFKNRLHLVFGALYEYLTQSRVERFLRERIDLRGLILISEIQSGWSFRKIVKIFNEVVPDRFDEFIENMPTLNEIWNGNISPSELAAHAVDLMLNGVENAELDIFKSDKILRRMSRNREKEIFKMGCAEDDIDKYKSTSFIKELSELNEIMKDAEDSIEWNEAWIDYYSKEKEKENDPSLMKVNGEYTKIEYDLESHDPNRKLNDDDRRMSDLSMAALSFNTARMNKDGTVKQLSENKIAELVQTLTKKGCDGELALSSEQVKEKLISLRDNYVTNIVSIPDGRLEEIKSAVITSVKQLIKSKAYEGVENKKIFVQSGSAGCGKTSYVIRNWSKNKDGTASKRDAYIVPFANTCMQTSDALKLAYGDKIEYAVKTYEKITELTGDNCGGGTLYIDEAGALSDPFIIFAIMVTKYERYVLMGDDEQTGANDNTGIMEINGYTTLIKDPSNIERAYYTFRYGPSAAAFANFNFNYPVFSLRNEDTHVKIRDLSEIDETTRDTVITISKKNQGYYEERIKNASVMTAKSSQGLTKKRVHYVLRGNDVKDALSFRANSIVAATRATTELNVYVDLVSKSTKAVSNFRAFTNNYATLFNVVISNVSDFS